MHKNYTVINDTHSKIILGKNIMHLVPSMLEKHFNPSKLFIITDSNVKEIIYKNLAPYMDSKEIQYEILIIEPGEESKSLAVFSRMVEEIISHKPDRNSLILGIGGGVVGDLSGFLASVILRGIRFATVPTTLLAQVDSSIGGKTAINSKFGKNLIGSFYDPELVIIDQNSLLSLAWEDYSAGYAEILKYALLTGKKFFHFLCDNVLSFKNRDHEYLQYITEYSIKTKIKFVKKDRSDKKQKRALLNFGHSFAHAIEQCFLEQNQSIRHGHAVFVGLLLAFKYSVKHDILVEKEQIMLIEKHLHDLGLMDYLLDVMNNKINVDSMIQHMFADKKNINNLLTLILPEKIGKAVIHTGVTHDKMNEFLLQTL